MQSAKAQRLGELRKLAVDMVARRGAAQGPHEEGSGGAQGWAWEASRRRRPRSADQQAIGAMAGCLFGGSGGGNRALSFLVVRGAGPRDEVLTPGGRGVAS